MGTETAKRPVAAEDLYSIPTITGAEISPDGSHVIYSQQRVDRKTEKKYSNLWLAPADGSCKPRQFTYGDHVDTAPSWSPDGRSIAFMSNRKDTKQIQLYILPMNGGEARPLTDIKGSINGFSWSPDSQKLAIVHRKKDADVLEREEDPQKEKLGVIERHITEIKIRQEDVGYMPKEEAHIYILDAASGEMTQLTDGDFSERSPVWSPDGATILFISNRLADRWLVPHGDELYTIPADGNGTMTKIDSHTGSKGSASFSPDGEHIVYSGMRLSPGHWYQNMDIYIVPVANDGESAINISQEFDHHFTNCTGGDVTNSPGMDPTFSYDSRYVYTLASRHGGNPFCRIDGTSGQLEKIIDDGSVVGMISLDESNDYAAFFRGTQIDPGNLWVIDLHTKAEVQITDIHADYLAEIEIGKIEEHWIKGKDGNDLHGWILTPPNFDPSKKYPSILEIHGGPQTQYGRTFFHEFYLLAAAGYVVHFSNPRSSQGYGEAHSAAIYSDWGVKDYADIMAWTDFVAEQPYIDTERMGITGGSYGGYMTSTAIGMTDRYKAAIVLRMLSNWVSFHGSSDMNWSSQYLAGFDGGPWEDGNLEHYWRMSPMSLVGNVETPTLVLHSGGDLRCPLEQSEQYFVALKHRGVDTEMVIFPEENHGLSRGGRTDRRIARLAHMLRWFDKHLK
ncbi:MAG: dipeptidyl aminopeptidase/acylaminoacyl peptidase [Cellvibrionaceae bacterium]|jgi:dipeptidyl aminopeptidase/acylaminoacyl peptidase